MAAIMELVYELMDARPKTKVLVMIGVAAVYVGWQMIKLLLPGPNYKYEGEYDEEGRYHGQGFLEMPNGDVFHGNFVHGKMTGQGEYVFRKAGRYEGMFKDSRYHGKGVEEFPDGSVYEGDFVAGKRHGEGTMKHADGWRYEGSWSSGKRDGQGTFTLANGSVYKGGFRFGKLHGDGRWTSPDGALLEGVWKDHKLVKVMRKVEAKGKTQPPKTFETETKDSTMHAKSE